LLFAEKITLARCVTKVAGTCDLYLLPFLSVTSFPQGQLMQLEEQVEILSESL
jgi:hypothetical protein